LGQGSHPPKRKIKTEAQKKKKKPKGHKGGKGGEGAGGRAKKEGGGIFCQTVKRVFVKRKRGGGLILHKKQNRWTTKGSPQNPPKKKKAERPLNAKGLKGQIKKKKKKRTLGMFHCLQEGGAQQQKMYRPKKKKSTHFDRKKSRIPNKKPTQTKIPNGGQYLIRTLSQTRPQKNLEKKKRKAKFWSGGGGLVHRGGKSD